MSAAADSMSGLGLKMAPWFLAPQVDCLTIRAGYRPAQVIPFHGRGVVSDYGDGARRNRPGG